MNTQLKTNLTGMALAVAAAGLMGCESSGSSSAAATATATASNSSGLVHCYGVNACNGHNDCKTASNAFRVKALVKAKALLCCLPRHSLT